MTPVGPVRIRYENIAAILRRGVQPSGMTELLRIYDWILYPSLASDILATSCLSGNETNPEKAEIGERWIANDTHLSSFLPTFDLFGHPEAVEIKFLLFASTKSRLFTWPEWSGPCQPLHLMSCHIPPILCMVSYPSDFVLSFPRMFFWMFSTPFLHRQISATVLPSQRFSWLSVTGHTLHTHLNARLRVLWRAGTTCDTFSIVIPVPGTCHRNLRSKFLECAGLECALCLELSFLYSSQVDFLVQCHPNYRLLGKTFPVSEV